MAISVVCPSCSAKYRVADTAAGKRVRCKACNTAITVPAPAASQDMNWDALQDLERSAKVDAGPPESSRTITCPHCRAHMPPGTVLCTSCGFDSRTGARAETVVARRPSMQPAKKASSSGFKMWLFWLLVYPAIFIIFIISMSVGSFAHYGAYFFLIASGLMLLIGAVLIGQVWKYDDSASRALMYFFWPYLPYYMLTRWKECFRGVTFWICSLVLIFLAAITGLRASAVPGVTFSPHHEDPYLIDKPPPPNPTVTESPHIVAPPVPIVAKPPEAPALPFPDRPKPDKSQADYVLYKMKLGKTDFAPAMQLWLYLPGGTHEANSLPCVLIPSAGDRMLVGSVIEDYQEKDHSPFARTGFAVVCYECSGSLPVGDTYEDYKNSVRKFMDADAGLANGRRAIEYISKKVPEVDLSRLYASGISMSGSLALNLAAADHRICAVAVETPIVDVSRNLDVSLDQLEKDVPGAHELAARVSPINHVKDFQCPVLVYHRDPKEPDPKDNYTDFIQQMKDAGKNIQLAKTYSIDFLAIDWAWNKSALLDAAYFESLGARNVRFDKDEFKLELKLGEPLLVDDYVIRSPVDFNSKRRDPARLEFMPKHSRMSMVSSELTVRIQTKKKNTGGEPVILGGDGHFEPGQNFDMVVFGATVDKIDVNGLHFARATKTIQTEIQVKYLAFDGNKQILIETKCDTGAKDAQAVLELSMKSFAKATPESLKRSSPIPIDTFSRTP